MRLNDLPLTSKLNGAIVLLIVAMLVVGTFTLWRSDRITSESGTAINEAQDIIRKSFQWQGMTQTAVARRATRRRRARRRPTRARRCAGRRGWVRSSSRRWDCSPRGC
ncbi:hypothetical protein ACQ859_24870 [Roseateles chitinivorans]|uniref:hypothetical protein n=1 Tax=Roseateles chitinivorans TaxID=2917965 RepID=UPI003D669EA7